MRFFLRSLTIRQECASLGIESKLFGLGVESHTVASHEYSFGYVISRGNLLYTLDAGHFHPTEVISAKISAVLQFVDQILLHVSRGVRWDSDHVNTLDDELQRIMDEIVWNNYEKPRVYRTGLLRCIDQPHRGLGCRHAQRQKGNSERVPCTR